MTELADRTAQTVVSGGYVELPRPAVAAPRQATAGPGRLRRFRAATPPYLYLLPALAGLVVWVYSPLVQTVQLSFYDWNLLPTTAARPVGTSNYAEVLALPELGRASGNTVLYIVGLLPFTIVAPVVIALLTRGLRGRAGAVYRAAIFAPYLMAPVATAIVWRWLLDPQGGLVNRMLAAVGIAPVNWLRDPDTAMWAIIVMVGWQLLGFAVLVVSAGLAAVSDDYAEAARMDGASESRITRLITLPLLSPTLLFMGLLTVLASAQLVFPLITTLTRGGPSDSTTNLYYLLYETAFSSFDVGRASAAGVLFFVVFGVFAFGAVRLMDRWSFHDD